MSSSRQGISELPYICFQHGIRHAVISPGSRNAPLIMAFKAHPEIDCHSITDERSAAYYAMGMAQFHQKPVVLICTSGTAALNYAPALAEAFYMRISLLVLTADRPPEWVDQSDGQTIRQNDIYRSFIKKSFVFPVETSLDDDLWHARRMVSEAIELSKTGKQGPAHINVPLREPLYDKLPVVEYLPPVIEILQGSKSLFPDQWEYLMTKWEAYSKKMIVCGMNVQSTQLNDILEVIARESKALVIAENLSNVSSPYFIDTPEQFTASLTESDKKQLAPDLLITIGGPVLSKRFKKFVRNQKPLEHWHIDENNYFVDTFKCLNKNIAVDPLTFFRKMQGSGKANQAYTTFGLEKQKSVKESFEKFTTDIPFSDLKAYDVIFGQIPPGYAIHMANSTPVRYAQLFSSRKDLTYFSNRGTSGIDGCISTAAGWAKASGKPTLLLVGDIAYIYDSNALWNNQLPPNLKIIVFENEGGNIFKLIETGPEIEKIKEFVETPHKVNLGYLSKAFGIEYQQANNITELLTLLPGFFKPNNNPVVLSIKTSGTESAQVFKKYFQFITLQK